LTRPQIIEAKSALTAYTAYYALIDQAYTKPGKDWSGPVAKLAADPEKSSLIRYLAATAKLGQYRSGHLQLYPKVTKVVAGVVDLTACVDATNVGFFDKTGSMSVISGWSPPSTAITASHVDHRTRCPARRRSAPGGIRIPVVRPGHRVG